MGRASLVGRRRKPLPLSAALLAPGRKMVQLSVCGTAVSKVVELSVSGSDVIKVVSTLVQLSVI